MFFKNWPPEWMCPYLRTPTTTQMQTPSWFYETFPVTELAKGTWKLHCTLYLKKKKEVQGCSSDLLGTQLIRGVARIPIVLINPGHRNQSKLHWDGLALPLGACPLTLQVRRPKWRKELYFFSLHIVYLLPSPPLSLGESRVSWWLPPHTPGCTIYWPCTYILVIWLLRV